ncbi:MAG TPA: gliding motility lipoprotein GldH [Cytophagaceae bacterium]
MKVQLLCFALLSLLIVSCDSNKIFDSITDLESGSWAQSNELEFQFLITDADVPYNIYYNVRYTDQYPYHNLYVNYTLTDTTGKEIEKALQNMDLFNPKTGVPYGSGIGNNFDYTILALKDYKFPSPGTYIFKTQQYMRQEELEGLAAFGVRVEKATKE